MQRTPIFQDQKSGESLRDYLERVVRPDEREKESFGRDVDTVVKFLQTQLSSEPYSVAEVYKGGSQKKGTAVKGSSDIDLVVFLNGIDDITGLQRQRKNLLKRIEQKIKELGWKTEDRPELSYPKKKKYGVGCRVGNHSVDILPAFDVVSEYGSPADVYKVMEQFRQCQCRRNRRKMYVGMEFSASLSPLQVEFIKPLPGHVKDVIRLLKKWKKEASQELSRIQGDTRKTNKMIPSYCLEILAAYQWQRTGSTSIDQLFRDVINMLTDCSTIQVAMSYDGKYDITEFTRNRPTPYILDPVNPYNNTFVRRTADFHRLEQKASETLRKLN